MNSINEYLKLDYTIQNPEERSKFLQEALKTYNPSTPYPEKYLDALADYIIFAMEKEERKQHNILTDNRLITINKRESSYEALLSKFENGEDGIYNLINETPTKNAFLTQKIEITDADVAEIAPLRSLKEAIELVKEQEKLATGRRKYLLKKQLIEMYQNQYMIKTEYRHPIMSSNIIKSFVKGDFSENITIDAEGNPTSDGILTFFNPKHISALLCNYSAIKEDAYGNFVNDAYYMMEDLDALVERTLRKWPLPALLWPIDI